MAKTSYLKLDQDYQRNYIINGNFDFWQRGVSFTAPSSSTYSADRFAWQTTGANVVNILRSTDTPSVDAPYSLHVAVTTADTSIAAGDFAFFQYLVEGRDFLPLHNKTITLSFKVKATKTGTYCVSFKNGNNDRSYVAEYTIDASDTWESKSITFKHDNTGTWNTTNGIGLQINWILAMGSTYHGTADSWQAGNKLSTSNQVNGVDSASNDFRIAQVQLTEGAEALPFRTAGKNFSEELAMCQRYYRKSYDINTVPGTASTELGLVSGSNGSASATAFGTNWSNKMRIVPTITLYNPVTGATGQVRGLTGGSNTAVTPQRIGDSGFGIQYTAPGQDYYGFQYTADAEL